MVSATLAGRGPVACLMVNATGSAGTAAPFSNASENARSMISCEISGRAASWTATQSISGGMQSSAFRTLCARLSPPRQKRMRRIIDCRPEGFGQERNIVAGCRQDHCRHIFRTRNARTE